MNLPPNKSTPPPTPRQPQPLTLIPILPRACPLCGSEDCEDGDTGACEDFAAEMERLDRDGGWK